MAHRELGIKVLERVREETKDVSKVELDPKQLKEFSEWSFLCPQDQERLVIALYSNQRSAKRNCLKTQRVLKVPDSKVFSISSSYLLSKGITRLIFDDLLIAIDKKEQ